MQEQNIVLTFAYIGVAAAAVGFIFSIVWLFLGIKGIKLFSQYLKLKKEEEKRKNIV